MEPLRRPPADRSKLDAAEAALRELEDKRKWEEADFHRQLAELRAKQMVAQQAYVELRKRTTAAVVDARQAYRKAGGTDCASLWLLQRWGFGTLSNTPTRKLKFQAQFGL